MVSRMFLFFLLFGVKLTYYDSITTHSIGRASLAQSLTQYVTVTQLPTQFCNNSITNQSILSIFQLLQSLEGSIMLEVTEFRIKQHKFP